MTAPVWITPAGSIGIFNAPISYQLVATPVVPATSLTYNLLSGELPPGVSISRSGLVNGTLPVESVQTVFYFTVRVTDNLGQIQDRSFNLTVTAAPGPTFNIPTGFLFSAFDSTWVDFPVTYDNPIASNPVVISLIEGELPSGLELNENGYLRGYATPPTYTVNYESVTTYATSSASYRDTITVISTSGFIVGRQVIFSGTAFGGLDLNTTYYVKSVIDQTTFTVSLTQNGPVVNVTNDSGFMTVTLPNASIGQPTVLTYSFTLNLSSPLGNDIRNYLVTIINQNTPTSQGGPGLPPNSRVPTILNTRPATFNIVNSPSTYSYYVLPPDSQGNVYQPTQNAYIGSIFSNEFFAFQILGQDFDGNGLTYNYVGLPLELVGDPITGWITGTPVISSNNINEYSFSVQVAKTAFPQISSQFFNFSFIISNSLNGTVTWLTSPSLGTISNGTVSTLKVVAECDVPLQYQITSGSLPPNLILNSDGEITGTVAFQPTDTILPAGATTNYSFTVQAFSPNYSVIQSSQTFNLSVYQQFDIPVDTLIMSAQPPANQRYILESLLQNPNLIPPSMIYRPTDPNFGVATSVNYYHAYGIYASDFDQYVAAITKNHYWRYLTLGQINTAQALDSNGNVVYEVVYSLVIDDLVNPQGISIPESIEWPRPILLDNGPWYASELDVFASYIFPDSSGQPTYYTSLDPGTVIGLYPNSLADMRKRVGQELGQVYDSNLLPLWMTSQQTNGSTLGYTPAWVICYTKPGTTTLNGQTVTYAQYIQYQIQNNWLNYNVVGTPEPYVLNQINFEVDKFTVDKSMTYDYNNTLSPPAWTDLPSGTPVPNPLDSKDFYVLFPRQTILPNR